MNKEELIKEYDEKAKALRDEFISKLEDDKKEFEISYPEPKSKVYYINSYTGEIHCILLNVIDKEVKHLYELGLYFDTKEEAEQFIKEQTLIKKIKCWAKEKNEGWEPDWSDDSQCKFSVDYNRLTGSIWATDSTVYNSFSKIPYFKTEEIAKECIDMFGDEIKEVLC